MWWNDSWRFRTAAVRVTPWRDDKPRPIEAVIDFPALLAGAGIEGEFDPASLRVVEPYPVGGGVEVPFACRTEYDPEAGRDRMWLTWVAQPKKGATGNYHIYFDTADRGIAAAEYDPASLPIENLIANSGFEDAENGLPAGWEATPVELVKLGHFKHTTGEQSVKIVVDENTPEDVEREVTLSQKIDVSNYAGLEMVFECDLYAERAMYGAPVCIEIQQFRADGSRILEAAVNPRWLTIDLAQGQLVQFRERGCFSSDAATANLVAHFRCHARDIDTLERLTGPESFFTVWLDRLVMRPGERWAWPAETRAGYVEGALEDAPLNRAFEFTGQRRLFFNGASEGTFTSEQYNPDPRAIHWGPEAGTLEFWCRPSWDAAEKSKRIFFEGTIHATKVQSRLSKVWVRGKCLLKFLIVDSDGKEREVTAPAPFQAGQWHHVAVTWNFPKAHLQIFFDGKRIGEEGPGEKPWASSLLPTGEGKKPSGFGIMHDDARSVPMQAYIGGDEDCLAENSAEVAMDEFRISDIPRYSEDFTPSRSEFETDDATRALFHFENERNGVHSSDDGFVQGYLLCELPRHEETAPLDVRIELGMECRPVRVNPYPESGSFEANRAKTRLDATGEPRELPDPRFVVHTPRQVERVVSSKEDAFDLEVEGDLDPQMRSVTFQRAEDADDKTTLLPRWRANDNVIPFSIEEIAATLAPDAKDDAERAFEIFKYSLDTTCYFNADYCETLPTRHRARSFWTFLKGLNIYPLNQCGPLNFMLRKLFLATGISCNNALGTHHQYQQTFYRGRWRLFDLAPRVYWLDRDNKTVAPWRTLQDDPYLLVRERGMIAVWMCGPPYGWQTIFGEPERPHKMDFPLRAGERASVCWHNEGRWTELRREREPVLLAKIPPHFGNGALDYTPADGGDATVLDNLIVETAADGTTVLRPEDSAKPASLIYRAECPYIFSDASVTGAYEGRKTKMITLSISFDKGKTWTQVWRNRGKTGEVDASLLNDVSARYEYWLKLDVLPRSEIRITDLHIRTTFVVAPLSLPGKLSRGQNRITFAGGSPSVPVKTVCRWVERAKSDLGVVFNTLSYYLNRDETHRNLLIVQPGQEASLDVTLLGKKFQGEAVLEGLPASWIKGSDRVEVEGSGDAVAATFRIAPEDAVSGDIRGFDVVLRGKRKERRVAAQVLVADAPLVREAESADEVAGDVAPVDLPEASGARVMKFTGDGTLRFDFSVAKNGKYILWLRAQWDNLKKKHTLTLSLDGKKPRLLHPAGLIGFTDWDSKRGAHAKKYLDYGESDTYWFRIPAVSLKAGKHTLTLGAQAGAAFDALALLPENDVMDRAGMNLFQNWNYAPWQNPF